MNPTRIPFPLRAAALTAALLTAPLVLGGCGASAAGAESDCAFTFSDTAITASGDETGYAISGTDLTISAAGTYTLTGSCADGSVTVEKGTDGVTLVLDGLTLAASDTAPITCGKETDVTIRATGENTLTDGEDADDDGVSDAFEGAAIKVKSGASLALTGDGTLTVDGSAKNGVKGGAESNITISSLTLTVSAANDALSCDGSVTIDSGALTLTADGDGIKASPDEADAASAGSVTLNGGTLVITSGGDGVQADGDLTITDGDVTVTSGGGYEAALAEDASAKGLKSGGTLTITGGAFTLDCADDAIHTNGDAVLSAGSYTIATGDDAVHADVSLTIGADGGDGPDIEVVSCYEGFESAVVTLYSGTGSITASDDGINAANASLGWDFDTAFGSRTGDDGINIDVCGGQWYVNAGGDGLDSNGSINLYGGTVTVFGAENSSNAALDYDGSCNYEGGTLLAVGMSGMAQTPSSGTYVSFGASGGFGGMGGGMMGGRGGMAAAGSGELPTDGTAPTDGGTPPTDGGTAPTDGAMGGRGGKGGMMPTDGTAPELPTDGTAPELPTDGTAPELLTDGAMGGRGQGGMGGMTETADTGISIAAGSVIEIQDSAGNVVAAATGVKNANCVVLAAESLTAGETYTLYIDGAEAASAGQAA